MPRAGRQGVRETDGPPHSGPPTAFLRTTPCPHLLHHAADLPPEAQRVHAIAVGYEDICDHAPNMANFPKRAGIQDQQMCSRPHVSMCTPQSSQGVMSIPPVRFVEGRRRIRSFCVR